MSNTECLRIADQLRRAFAGEAWHGPAIGELLSGVTAKRASARPVAGAHSIWELVLHVEAWMELARRATGGAPMPIPAPAAVDWPAAGDSDAAWEQTPARLHDAMSNLCRTIEQFGDVRLAETVPGRKYDFYFLFHGIVQHSLYHAGQIALLKKTIAQQQGAGNT